METIHKDIKILEKKDSEQSKPISFFDMLEDHLRNLYTNDHFLATLAFLKIKHGVDLGEIWDQLHNKFFKNKVVVEDYKSNFKESNLDFIDSTLRGPISRYLIESCEGFIKKAIEEFKQKWNDQAKKCMEEGVEIPSVVI